MDRRRARIRNQTKVKEMKEKKEEREEQERR